MKIRYKLKRLGDIYLASFSNPYDLAMMFVRFQEYYECASSKFRGKSFKLIDFMEYYAKAYGNGVFSYPMDWQGFNIPGSIIKEVFAKGISDPNKYDATMWDLFQDISRLSPEFYLIGALDGDEETLYHEISHGLYALNSNYKAEMNNAISGMKKSDQDHMYSHLKLMGYARRVLDDELQAYMATGLVDDMKKRRNSLEKATAPFQEIFSHYLGELLSNSNNY